MANPNKRSSQGIGLSQTDCKFGGIWGYAALEAQWHRELRPQGLILKNLVTGIVRNLWLQLRNVQATAIYASCHPFGRTIAEAAGDGDWVEAARKHSDDLNARHMAIVEHWSKSAE